MRLKTRLLLFLVPAIFVTLAVLTFLSYRNADNQANLLGHREADLIATAQSARIFDKLRNAEGAARALTYALRELRAMEEPSREARSQAVKGVAESSKDFFGVWALWEANAYDGKDAEFVGNPDFGNKTGAANAYWLRDGDGVSYDISEDFEIEHYYILPLNSKRFMTIPPYRDKDTPNKTLMTSITMPILDKGKALGVVGVDLEMEFIQGLIKEVKPYETGYAMLVSDTGAIIAQPVEEKERGEKLPVVADDILRKIREGKAFTLPGVSVFDASPVQCFYTPVKLESFEAPWYFMVALPMDKVTAESRRSLYLQLGIGAAALLVLVGLVFYVAGSVAAPLQRIAAYSKEVAGGKYNAGVDRSGFVFELMELQAALQSMLDSLLETMAEADRRKENADKEAERARSATGEAEKARLATEENHKSMLEVAQRVNAVSEKLQVTAHELSQKIASAGREVQEQNNLMAETVVAISGMGDSILRVSANAEDAAQFTERTRERAREGADVVNQTLEAFDSIRKETESLGGQIEDLAARTEAIGEILRIINDIADQTNLLALNAAIEAARAGEAGRGFAVVADEVRKLAEKTVEATKQVGEAVGGIRTSMRVSADGVARTAKTVNDTVDLGMNAQNSLKDIVELVQRMSEQIHDIAGLCGEQAKTSEGVADTVERLRQSSVAATEAMDEGAAITHTLEPEARDLGRLMEQLTKKKA